MPCNVKHVYSLIYRLPINLPHWEGMKSTDSSTSPKRLIVTHSGILLLFSTYSLSAFIHVNNWFQFSLNPSMAPQRMRLSRSRLLTTLLSARLQKSTISVYRPCSLVLANQAIDGIIPYVLDAPRPKANGIILYGKAAFRIVNIWTWVP